jgi:hypothetical protein
VWESRDVATQNLDWDGCNKAGKPLADGLYLVSLRGKDFHTLGKIARVTR